MLVRVRHWWSHCDLLCLDLEAAEEVRAALNRGRAVSIARGQVKALAGPDAVVDRAGVGTAAVVRV